MKASGQLQAALDEIWDAYVEAIEAGYHAELAAADRAHNECLGLYITARDNGYEY